MCREVTFKIVDFGLRVANFSKKFQICDRLWEGAHLAQVIHFQFIDGAHSVLSNAIFLTEVITI